MEPSAFTKISALGIEEQRANVVADFVDPPGPLGDGYRVEVRIIIWESEAVLKVPTSALFRHGDGWSVFAVENGKAIDARLKYATGASLRQRCSVGLKTAHRSLCTLQTRSATARESRRDDGNVIPYSSEQTD